MTGNIQEDVQRERTERRLKKLEYTIAITRMKRNHNYYGSNKRNIKELKSRYDYKEGMFDGLKRIFKLL